MGVKKNIISRYLNKKPDRLSVDVFNRRISVRRELKPQYPPVGLKEVLDDSFSLTVER